ncbi:hypothetical protein LOCC1_G005789 [Lachnellula occidentalis]|uniref:MYND-type domain-containing protein n=1 Tax=Lachnellula occidentalis TaxID=215460 RepID=A0A8H8UFF2_9HELO|nr:hypothetical protein LOCC1_G005789 [Lachnellula occidentalis]
MSQRATARVSLADMMGMKAEGEGNNVDVFNQPKCTVCNIIETDGRKLLTCTRCKKTRYCSKNCQADNWGTHKSTCKAQNYILKISLCPTEITNPSVNRTLSCPSTATFEQLHRALQIAFGWAGTQTYDFKILDPNAQQPEPQPDMIAYVTRRLAALEAAQSSDSLMPDAGPRQNLLRIIEKGAFRPGEFDMGSGKKVDAMHNSERVHSQTPEIDSKKIKLGKVLENKEYEGAELQYEYDFGDCWQHTIQVVGRMEASKGFLCFDGEGHGVAEDAGSVPGWLELREAYRTANPTTEQMEKRTWFETMASNNDPRGLGNGSEWYWDGPAAVSAKLRRDL